MTPPTRTFRGSKKENFQGSVKHWLEGSVRSGFSTQNERLSNSCSELFRVVLVILLSDAEAGENSIEGFLGRDLTTRDFGENGDDIAKVFCKEVTR